MLTSQLTMQDLFAQVSFLRTALLDDAGWAELNDVLNVRLHAPG
ncbi:DUF2789 domain-containing protein [Aestuariibacter sp. A3R04]|nr:DUF2789 domain-containing protein [Aestuariibacter sp. A3R04]